MTNKKKDYQEPALDVIKMKYCARLLDDSYDAEHPDARQNDMDDY